MAETIVQINEGSGKKLHAWDRVVGANTVLDEFTLRGVPNYASYVVRTAAISTATANSHLLALQAGSSLNVYVTKVIAHQVANAGALSGATFELLRLTSAGSGGTAITPEKLDTADAASGATARALPSTKGSEGGSLGQHTGILYNAYSAWPVAQLEVVRFEFGSDWSKPLKIAAGTANGMALKGGGVASATVVVECHFFEAAY